VHTLFGALNEFDVVERVSGCDLVRKPLVLQSFPSIGS
jgi:hypothetical protein